ncbi:hypothetical protein BLNAU_11295 [Blattamonas nauphoetae]|uniref:Uncharacterized protein n=1 Tax=Blattamonas nauphoetae TaxID=2049346 RepID=A0ABQ9XMX2_9EUKA|nr:hypothetical protein BLNAU_11295 [Blattamonas nauphoetae]
MTETFALSTPQNITRPINNPKTAEQLLTLTKQREKDKEQELEDLQKQLRKDRERKKALEADLKRLQEQTQRNRAQRKETMILITGMLESAQSKLGSLQTTVRNQGDVNRAMIREYEERMEQQNTRLDSLIERTNEQEKLCQVAVDMYKKGQNPVMKNKHVQELKMAVDRKEAEARRCEAECASILQKGKHRESEIMEMEKSDAELEMTVKKLNDLLATHDKRLASLQEQLDSKTEENSRVLSEIGSHVGTLRDAIEESGILSQEEDLTPEQTVLHVILETFMNADKEPLPATVSLFDAIAQLARYFTQQLQEQL